MKKTIVPVLIMAFITASYHGGGKIGRFYSNGKRLLGLY